MLSLTFKYFFEKGQDIFSEGSLYI